MPGKEEGERTIPAASYVVHLFLSLVKSRAERQGERGGGPVSLARAPRSHTLTFRIQRQQGQCRNPLWMILKLRPLCRHREPCPGELSGKPEEKTGSCSHRAQTALGSHSRKNGQGVNQGGLLKCEVLRSFSVHQ